MTTGLWPHQKKTLKLYQKTPLVFDISDAGTGKSRAALEAFKARRRSGGGRALIVAPKTLLDAAWGAEIDKFTPELKYRIAYATNRLQAFSEPVDVYITNTDAVKWLAEQPDAFFKTFDTLIIDECSSFKHRQSKRSKAMKKISKHFKYRALLSATPTSKSVTELWHQALILDGGQRLGKSFMKFRDAVCEPEYTHPYNTQFVKWHDKPKAYHSVARILSDVTVRHEFHDAMKDVPENTEHMVYFTIPPKLMNAYVKLKEEALLRLEEGDVDAVNAAVLRGKLLQLTSGSVYGTDKTVVIDAGRTELIVQLVMERKHSIVFYNWNHQREALVKELTKQKVPFAEITSSTKGSDRGKIVAQYQAGEYQTMLMHPQTGAHGLTLTRGTATIWCSPTDRPDLLLQGKHRVLRGGQTEVTENVMVCARGTLEEGVYAQTNKQRDDAAALMELLRG